jgi:hypothetical protein
MLIKDFIIKCYCCGSNDINIYTTEVFGTKSIRKEILFECKNCCTNSVVAKFDEGEVTICL